MTSSATNDELKAAYRERARRLHPDASGGRTSGEMAALNEAWRVLRDPSRRAIHDADLAAAARAPYGSAAMPGSESVRYGPAPGPAPVRSATPTFSGRGVLLAAVVALMGIIFVATAFAGGGGPEADDAPQVDGYLAVGNCVRLAGDAVLTEVACDVANDGVVAELVRMDAACPPGTSPFISTINNLRVCVEFRPSP